MAFYSTQEFMAQMQECTEQGMSLVQAYQTVTEREQQEQALYQRWLEDLFEEPEFV